MEDKHCFRIILDNILADTLCQDPMNRKYFYATPFFLLLISDHYLLLAGRKSPSPEGYFTNILSTLESIIQFYMMSQHLVHNNNFSDNFHPKFLLQFCLAEHKNTPEFSFTSSTLKNMDPFVESCHIFLKNKNLFSQPISLLNHL